MKKTTLLLLMLVTLGCSKKTPTSSYAKPANIQPLFSAPIQSKSLPVKVAAIAQEPCTETLTLDRGKDSRADRIRIKITKPISFVQSVDVPKGTRFVNFYEVPCFSKKEVDLGFLSLTSGDTYNVSTTTATVKIGK